MAIIRIVYSKDPWDYKYSSSGKYDNDAVISIEMMRMITVQGMELINITIAKVN